VPRLDAGIQVQHAALQAVLDQHRARDVHRQVEEEITLPQQWIEYLPVVVVLERVDDELDAVVRGFLPAAVVAGEDGNALRRHLDVPQDEGECALTDGTETDENQPPVELDMLFFLHSIVTFVFRVEV
jgi:hypothetical protein